MSEDGRSERAEDGMAARGGVKTILSAEIPMNDLERLLRSQPLNQYVRLEVMVESCKQKSKIMV
jgi:hypothetical protein